MNAGSTGPVEPALGVDFVGDAGRHLAAGDAQAAIDALRRATGEDAHSLRLRFVMGLVAWRLADVEQAIAILRDCHEEAPMNGSIAEVLASLYAQAGNLGESLYLGKLATALGDAAGFAELVPPQFPSFGAAFLAIRERPLFARARMLVGSGKLLDGLDLARQHVALNPGDQEASVFLGEGLLRAGGAAAAASALAPIATSSQASPMAMSLYGRALASVGERAEARRYHVAACAAAPDDAAIAAARVADAQWLDDDQAAVAAVATDWARRFCPPRKAAVPAPSQTKLVIGYAFSCLADPRDAAAIAAVAQAHDRAGVTVIGYGTGAQSWPENVALSGAFDRWRDISGLEPATLARILSGDGLNVLIDCSGAAAPRQLQAIGRLNTAVRVAWLGVPAGLGAPLFDAVLGSGVSSLPTWGSGPAYPLVREWLRSIERTESSAARFGADVRLSQLDERTVRLWSGVLSSAPQASLVLRANDMAPGTNIDRLVARFGRDLSARIDIVDAIAPEDFYAQVDIALAPVKGVSARLAAEALACGVPVVALAGDNPAEPYGAFLRDLGLSESLVAADDRDFVSIACGLAGAASARRPVAEQVAEIAKGGPDMPRRIAQTIETKAADTTAVSVRQ
jgi:tetratricopeptide (TPR) repeat protein